MEDITDLFDKELLKMHHDEDLDDFDKLPDDYDPKEDDLL